MLKTAPDPIDVQDVQFKLHCRLRIFDNIENVVFSRHCSLVACASRFGLIFVGTNTSNIQAIQLKHIEKLTKNDGDKADYPRRNLRLPTPPSHLSVNCEHTVLAVVVEKNCCPFALFYDVKSFWQQDIVQIGEICLSPTPGVYVTETNWNPALSSIFTACKSDGSLGICELRNGGVDINELPAAAGATCFCWSPKGKQIAVGSRDGRITQLKPDLKAVKVISAPPLKEPHSLLSLQWVSNYQFIGIFQSVSPSGQAVFIVIDAPKSGDTSYINYDDICYSNGNARPVQFYMMLLQSWNIVLAASSNSMEVGILGNTGDCWSQWIMGDAARAELPLSINHQETLPIGCALDYGSIQPIPWGESTLPPAPLLLLFSHHGTLCCFNVINLKQGIPSLCAPPETINDTSGLQHFVISSVEQKSGNLVKESNKIEQQSTQLCSAETSKTSSTLINTSTVLKVEPQVTAVTQGLNLCQGQPVNLFGGQATLTPLAQGIKNTQTFMPQYQSILSSPSSNIPKSMTATSAKILPSTAAASPVISKPVATVSNSTLKLSQPESNECFNRAEINNVDVKVEEETEKIFGQMVREECIFLESEVKAVLYQGKKLKVSLGSDANKMKIVESTKSLENFFHEVVEICVTQNAEVHILKQNLLQSWAWYEEAKSRHLASDDESMVILIRAQPLDSASEKQLVDMQHLNYYLESQIAQAHNALDEQWEKFQDYCKKTHKFQIPTMEMIFQTMVKQNAILQKQSYILKDIANRIKNKSRSALGSSLLITVDDVKNLPDELKQLRMNPEDIYQMRHEHVVKKLKNFTKKKVDALRTFLKKREYPHVSAVKPQLSTSVIQTSPSPKLKQYSLSTSKTSPLGQEVSQKKLDFVQSTPTPTNLKGEPITSKIPSSTPIEGLQNFALVFQARNFSDLTDKSFTPLSKNLIASSPHSAFVATSLGSSTSSVTSLASKPILGLSSVATVTPSVAKMVPSLVVVTTIPQTSQSVVNASTNLSKPFSFVKSPTSLVSSQENISNLSKPGVNIFSNKTPVLGIADIKTTTTKPTYNTSNKPHSSAVSSFNVTQPTKFAMSTINSLNSVIPSKTVASSFPYSSTATSVAPATPFSFGASSALNIFAAANQNSSESSAPAAVNKPFVFSSKTVAPTSPLIQNLLMTQQGTEASNSQPANFSTTAAASVKITNVSQSSVFTTPSEANTAISSVVSAPQAILLTSKINTTSSAPSSTQPVLFTSAVTTTTAQSTVFSMTGTKPPLFTPASNLVGSSSLTVSTAAATNAVSITSVTATDNNTSSSVTTTGSDQSTRGKQNILNSAVGSTSSNSSPFSSDTSAIGFTFNNTSADKPSVFSSAEATYSTPLLFGNSSVTATTHFGNLTTLTTTTSTTQSSIFGFAPSTTTTASSIFGAVPPTSTDGFGSSITAPTQSLIFGAVPNRPTNFAISSASTIFGSGSSISTTGVGTLTTSTAQSLIFGTTSSTKTQSSISGAISSTSATAFETSTTSTTQSSIFSADSSTSTGFGTSIFTTQPSIFGTPPATSTTSIFGTPTSSATKSIFASGTANQTSVFGGAVSTAAPQSIFGNPSTSATSQSSQGFGNFEDGRAQKSSVFGNPVTAQSSVFGSSNQPTVFDNTTSTPSSVFGQNQSSDTFGQSSVFGSSVSSFGTSNVFGASAPSFGQSTGSIFGNTPSTTSGSIFGGAATTGNTFASSGTVFGTPASSTTTPFGSGSVFSSGTTQPSSFSANSNTGTFGFGGLNVGSVPTTSNSSFGANSTSNPFGSDDKNVFGSSSSSVFSSNSGPGFGGPSQGFGGGFGNQSPFGQQSAFGQTSFGSNSFGQTSSGPFSSGSSGGVGQTGFGTSTSFQKTGGFGSSPVFGGSPSFGSSPSFGGTPAFGSPPTFGSGSKIFGSANPGFGAADVSRSTGFGNLARQPTVGFGNLAQQAANSATPGTPFSGNSSFSSWR